MISVTLEVTGFEEVTRVIDQMPDNLSKAMEQSVWKICQHIVERGVANAPILSGDLRSHLIGYIDGKQVASESASTPPPHQKDREEVVGIITDTVPYAQRMHELLVPAGPLNLGPISRLQPMTPEGGVGGKYITRVVDFHIKTYTAMVARIVSETLRKGAPRVSIRVSQ